MQGALRPVERFQDFQGRDVVPTEEGRHVVQAGEKVRQHLAAGHVGQVDRVARAELAGLNIVGLKRRGFDRPTIHALRAAYQAVFNGEGSRTARVDRIAEEFGKVPAVMAIVDFVRAGGDRPLVTPRD